MFEYDNIKINYKDYGKKDSEAIVYLHGWGQNIEMMEPIANPFEKNNRIVIIDLPGFGKSEEPKTSWTLEDYVTMIHKLLKELKINNPNIIGHSFGGKLGILYASKYSTKRLVLLASPFKVEFKKQPLKVRVYKRIKKVSFLKGLAEIMKNKIGSTDYKNATPRMREILVKHVNTDLTEEAKKIKCPTLIIWGTNDTAVKVEDAYILEKLIEDSGVVIYEGCTHYAYLERLNQTIRVLQSFIK
jgi:pimeloyl-ACP methyl ester carboxylesterase